MQKPHRRFWLPLLLALLCGAGVWWGVGEWLRPKPLWEMQLKEGQIPGLLFNQLYILKPLSSDYQQEAYAVEDGRALSVVDLTEDQGLEPLPVKLPSMNDRYSFSNTRQLPVLSDLQTGKKYRFHGNRHDELFDLVHFPPMQLGQHVLLSRSLPLDLPARFMQAFSSSPGHAMGQAFAACYPGATPAVATVVTVPRKELVGKLFLEPLLYQAQLQVSEGGKYIAVRQVVNTMELDGDIGFWNVSHRMKGELYGVWNVTRQEWLELPKEFQGDIKQLSFFGDDLLLDYTDLLNKQVLSANALHLPTGKVIASVDGPHLFQPEQSMLQTDTGIYLTRHHKEQNQATLVKLLLTHTGELQPLGNYALPPGSLLNYITQGPQTVYYANSRVELPPFLKQYLPDRWHKQLLSWLSASRVQVYDWRTGRTWEGWRGAMVNVCSKGKYIAVSTYHRDMSTSQLVYEHVQVYQMPLALYPPWWYRGAGLTAFILVFIAFRWGKHRLQKRC